MLKKRISFLMVLAMLVTLMFGTVPANAKEGFVASGYTIMDSAYNDGTYVLMAKNFNDGAHPAKLYSSKNGKDWVEVLSVAAGRNYGNMNSRQELVWWEAEGVYVAQFGGSLYVSSDATTWTQKSGISNGVIETNGTLLINAGGQTMKIYKNFTDEPETVTLTDKGDYYVKGAALGYDNEKFISLDQYTLYFFGEKNEDETRTVSFGYPNLEGGIYDAAYIPGREAWIVTLNSAAVRLWNTANNSLTGKRIPLFSDGTVNESIIKTAEADAETVVAGTVAGDVLFTANADITNETVWEKETPASGTTAITSEITTISSTENGEFIVATATDIYNLKKTASGYEYSDMLSYQEIEEAKVIGTLPFDGVSIMGGVYSPELNRYVAYGNDAEGIGCIFYSDDGINWNETGVGTSTRTHGFTTDTKNLAVWWPAQQAFVINLGNSNLAGAGWYSKDGISWQYGEFGYGVRGDLTVAGDYLYSANYGSMKAIRKYSDLSNTAVSAIYSPTDKSYNLNTIAVSDDETPVVLAATSYGQVYVNELADSVNTATEPSHCTPGGTGPTSYLKDAHWNTYVDKFVAVNAANNVIYLIDSNATVESVVPSADSGILAAIDTNGSSYLTGGANGTIYYSNTQNISTSSTFTAVPANGEANTLPVTNIFVGKDGKYFVTVSDGVESDILIVNADGSAYTKASDMTVPESIKAGDIIKIAVKTANYAETAETIRLIAAIYDSTGTQLLQVVSEDKTMGLNKDEIQELEVTVEEGVSADSKLKVFIWDSLNGMVPVADAKAFF